MKTELLLTPKSDNPKCMYFVFLTLWYDTSSFYQRTSVIWDMGR